MARCRSLLQENESIGKMIASGRVAKIEGELALQRRLVDEMKSGQAGKTRKISLLPRLVIVPDKKIMRDRQEVHCTDLPSSHGGPLLRATFQIFGLTFLAVD